MEHAKLSSSEIFVCHVNFSRRLEAESAAFSVLLVIYLPCISRNSKKEVVEKSPPFQQWRLALFFCNEAYSTLFQAQAESEQS